MILFLFIYHLDGNHQEAEHVGKSNLGPHSDGIRAWQSNLGRDGGQLGGIGGQRCHAQAEKSGPSTPSTARSFDPPRRPGFASTEDTDKQKHRPLLKTISFQSAFKLSQHLVERRKTMEKPRPIIEASLHNTTIYDIWQNRKPARACPDRGTNFRAGRVLPRRVSKRCIG